MKITRDGDTILNIEYSEKEIRPYFSRETKRMEYDCYLDGQYIGTARDSMEAHQKLDALVYEQLTRAIPDGTPDDDYSDVGPERSPLARWREQGAAEQARIAALPGIWTGKGAR